MEPPDESDSFTFWIVDDHEGYRRDLAIVLERRGHRAGKSFASARGLFAELARGPLPDVLLLDLRMPGVNGIEALTEIRNSFSSLLVLILTSSDEARDLRSALAAGADGYLLKTSTPSEIEQAVRRGRAGGKPIDPDMSAHLLGAFGRVAESETPVLSPKETEVLQLLAEGEPAKGIAARLGLSVHTVDSHLRSIYRKLGAANQSAAVARAFRWGLLK